MNKKMAETLDLPNLDDLMAENNDEIPDDNQEMLAILDDAEQALSTLDSVQANVYGKSMDDVYEQTMQHSQDLMSLGYDVDIRAAGKIFENATQMYNIAMNAKTHKRILELKTAKIELELRKLELAERIAKSKLQENEPEIIETSAVAWDRNELLKMMREEDEEEKKAKKKKS